MISLTDKNDQKGCKLKIKTRINHEMERMARKMEYDFIKN